MKMYGKGNAGPLPGASCKDAEVAEHMPIDVLVAGGIFRFMGHLFHSRHPVPFFGLFHSVSHEDADPTFHIDRG